MGLIAPTIPSAGSPRGSEEVDVINALTALVNLVNGSLDSANLAANAVTASEVTDAILTADKLTSAVRQQLGLTDSSSVRRGKSIIATEETRTNVAFGTMTTPDRVQNVVLPTDGLIVVSYMAIFKSSVSSVGKAAIFIGANQLKANDGLAPPGTAIGEATTGSTANTYKPVATHPGGLYSSGTGSGTAYTGHVTTGQAISADATIPAGAGPCYIFAAAGTYDVSIQFKSSSGSVSVKERNLWVWTLGF